MKIAGIVAMIIGAVIVLISYFMDITVPSFDASSILGADRVVNLAKLQQQALIFGSGSLILLAGAIFTAAGIITERFDAREMDGGLAVPGGGAAPAPQEDASPAITRQITQEMLDSDKFEHGPLLLIIVAVCVIAFFAIVLTMK